jgi:hypothetical protein
MISAVARLLGKCDSPERNFPPTDLYNEGWMLRLVLDWLADNPGIDHPLSFSPSDRWHAEALLPSAFLARYRGDSLAESWTHADAAIGDIAIGVNRDGDLTLTENASRFLVTEAKMFSKLSSGVKNAAYFNQAARNVACIAEVVRRAGLPPEKFTRIAFYIIAPKSQIQDGLFAPQIDKEHIRETVRRRVSDYNNAAREQWFAKWFLPTLNHTEIAELSWEGLIDAIGAMAVGDGGELGNFYEKCLQYNRRAYSVET